MTAGVTPRGGRPTGASLGEHVCLTLIAHEAQHGWALVRALAPDTPIGRVWSLSRPLTYRAIDGLLERGWVMRAGAVPGDGPMRQPLRATAAGRRASRAWLDAPVAHVREVRTELVVKLVLHARLGLDPRPLLRAQRDELAPVFAALREAARRRDADDVDRWRHESSQAVRRFLDASIAAAGRRMGDR